MSDSPFADIRIGEISSRWALGSHLPCRYEATTGSTNDLAKEEAFDAAVEDAVKVYLTDNQTKGRGRGQNTWSHGTPGSSLLSSWSFALQDPPKAAVTPRLGLALIRALSTTWSFVPWSLKAPNDIFIGDKKVAGLLTETISQGPDVRLIVGLGLNVYTSPDQIENATDLAGSFPEGIPLLGEDWIAFLERWMFELSGVVATADQEISASEGAALVDFINRRPGQKKIKTIGDVEWP